MDELSSQTYPQKVGSVSVGVLSSPQVGSQRPSVYRFGDGAEFLKPAGKCRAERTPLGVRMTCTTEAFGNHYVYTHETAMFQPSGIPGNFGNFVLEIELWRKDILRVRFTKDGGFIDRFAGLPKEMRMLIAEPEEVPFSFTETDENVTLSTAAMTITVGKMPLTVAVTGKTGKEVFSETRYTGIATDVLGLVLEKGGNASFEALTLDEDEEIYGLGERFDAVARKGRVTDFHNKDCLGSTSRRSYVNIPFYLSTKGYGLFLNSSAQTEWEIGTVDSSALQFGTMDGQMDYFVMLGDKPADILKNYCRLTGFSKLPPLWSYGLWMSRNSYLTWEIAEEVGHEMRKRGIPCDVLHLDTAWFTEDWNCDLRFSKERFPDPEKHLSDLRKEGFRVSLWQYNFIPPRANNANYAEAKEKGYLATDDTGNVYRLPESCHGGWVDDAIIDFTNPEARAWYGEQIKELMKQGASAIKTDFGEGVSEDAHYQNMEGRFFHNLYPLPYNHTVWQATKEVTGDDIVWARSGTAGSQRFPIHWGGDSQSTFEGLAGTVRAALSIGLSGIPFFSHDIGGFIGMPTPELYVRWAQFGLFSSHSRCHGMGNHGYREPWKYGEEAERIFRSYALLRYSLMPYIIRESKKCVESGLPMIRAMWLVCPGDRNVRHIEDQYFFGDDLLIAPILKPMSKSKVRDLYLPAGTWTDFFTKEKIVSRGEWITRPVTLDVMPIYVKEGAVLEFCEPKQHLSDGYGEIVRTERY